MGRRWITHGTIGMVWATAAIACIFSVGTAGCSLFHHGDPPQQQFMNALNRGNGAEANTVWLKMSAKDRSNLSHSIGFKQKIDKDDVGRALLKHQEEEARKNGDEQSDLMDDTDSASDSEQVEIPGMGDGAPGGLSNLPLLNQPAANPITEIRPQ